jgi:hypothetical protein
MPKLVNKSGNNRQNTYISKVKAEEREAPERNGEKFFYVK